MHVRSVSVGRLGGPSAAWGLGSSALWGCCWVWACGAFVGWGIEWLVWVLVAFPGAGDSVICAELPMRSRFFQNFFLFPSEKHFFFFFGMWAKALLMARVRELDVPCF